MVFFSLGNIRFSLVDAESMKGVEIVTFIAENFDQEELNTIQSYLEMYGANVTIAGIERNVSGVTANILISNMNISKYNCILIPGGGSPANLVEHEEVLELIRTANSKGILLAGICHGPLVFAEAGVVNGTDVTGHDDIRAELESAGGNYVVDSVVIDGFIITANWPFFRELSLAIADVLGYYETDAPIIENCDWEIIQRNNEEILYSLTVKVTDETGIFLVTADVYEVSEGNTRFSYPTTSVVLADKNEDGIFNGSFPLEEGYYSVDIETEDVFNNVRIFSNVTYITEISESLATTEISTSVTETTQTSTAFPELIIVWISLSVPVIHFRKRNRK